MKAKKRESAMTSDRNFKLTPEGQVVKDVFAAINRNDIPVAMAFFDPQIVRIEPEGFATEGTYRGLAEVSAHLSKGRGTWAEGSCEPEQLIVAGDKIVALLYVRVKLKDRSDWIEGRFADVFTFRAGKVIEMRTFAERQQALEWAGAKSDDSN
jgi:ketosteroid isomerase-like protein